MKNWKLKIGSMILMTLVLFSCKKEIFVPALVAEAAVSAAVVAALNSISEVR